jgi:hypothetical protein
MHTDEKAPDNSKEVGVLNYGVERKKPLVMAAGCAMFVVLATLAVAAVGFVFYKLRGE